MITDRHCRRVIVALIGLIVGFGTMYYFQKGSRASSRVEEDMHPVKSSASRGDQFAIVSENTDSGQKSPPKKEPIFADTPIAVINNETCPDEGPPKITVSYAGRLGNKMFQIAALLGTAKVNSKIPVLPVERYLKLASTFPKLNITTCRVPDHWSTVTSSLVAKRENKLEETGNVILNGFFNSWKYFAENKDVVRDQFRFSERLRWRVNKFFNIAAYGLERAEATFIGVHIRRGDTVWKDRADLGFVVSNITYVNRAMQYYEQKYKSVVFVVCSDDMVWCIENIKSKTSRVVFSTFPDPESDLCLLASCNHTIMTHGTFGWWAGWLAGGDVVYDVTPPTEGSHLSRYYKQEDMYPSNWIPL